VAYADRFWMTWEGTWQALEGLGGVSLRRNYNMNFARATMSGGPETSLNPSEMAYWVYKGKRDIR